MEIVKLIQISNGDVFIVNGDVFYNDTYDNYILDGGSIKNVNLLVHDSQQNYCEVDGNYLSYPQQTYVDEIERVDRIIKNREQRIYDSTPLETFKNNKILELKYNRDIDEMKPVAADKGAFDVDNKSLERINGAITVLKISGSTIDWTLADNTVVPVTADDLTNVIVALAQQSNAVHEKYRQLKEQVEACTTKEQVEAIEW